tara:strand:+ start:2319 stop:2930 length:612 start_codon:yes stop_codon:yes gene_type:complete
MMSDTQTFTDEALLDQILEHAASEERIHDLGGWNMPKEDILDAISKISWHESKHDPTAVQVLDDGSEGKASGLFQYETGENEGAHTATNRAIEYFELDNPDLDTPQWLIDEHLDKDYDISDLNEVQQSIIMLIDKMKHPTATMSDINETGVGPNWARDHWVGDEDADESLLKTRLNQFEESMKTYEDTLLDILTAKKDVKPKP